MNHKKKKSRNFWNLNLVLLLTLSLSLCGIFLFETLFERNTLKNGGGERNDNDYKIIQLNRFEKVLSRVYYLLTLKHDIYNYDLSVNKNKDLKNLFNHFYNILLGKTTLDMIEITPIAHVFQDPIKTDKYHLLGYIYQYVRRSVEIDYKVNPCIFFVKNLLNNGLELYFILPSDTIVEEVHYPDSIGQIATYLEKHNTV